MNSDSDDRYESLDSTWDAPLQVVHESLNDMTTMDRPLTLKEAHRRESTNLTVKLLNEISSTVKKEKLRPSRSLDFSRMQDTDDQTAEIDVVISGIIINKN